MNGIEEVSTEVIVAYTSSEGGKWKDWPPFFHNTLPSNEKLEEGRQDSGARRTNRVLVNDFYVHSFKISNGRVYDALNGWRK